MTTIVVVVDIILIVYSLARRNNKINDIQDWAVLDKDGWRKKWMREVIPMIYVTDVIFCECVCGASKGNHAKEGEGSKGAKTDVFFSTKRSLLNKLYHYMNQTPALNYCRLSLLLHENSTLVQQGDFQFYLLHAKSHFFCHMLFSLITPWLWSKCIRAQSL